MVPGQAKWTHLKRSQGVKQQFYTSLTMTHSSLLRSGRQGGRCAIRTVAWSRCPLGTISGSVHTSCSVHATIALVTRRRGKTTSTWMRVSVPHGSSLSLGHPTQLHPTEQLLPLFLFEGDAAAFDDEWRRETSRFRTQRGLEYRRHDGGSGRRAEGTRLAIQGPEESPTRQSRRYDW